MLTSEQAKIKQCIRDLIVEKDGITNLTRRMCKERVRGGKMGGDKEGEGNAFSNPLPSDLEGIRTSRPGGQRGEGEEGGGCRGGGGRQTMKEKN